MDMAEQTLMNELNKLLRKKFRQPTDQDIPDETIPVPTFPAEQPIEVNYHDSEYQEKDIIRLMLTYSKENIEIEEMDEHNHLINSPVNVARFMTDDLKNDEIIFSNPVYQKVFDEFADLLSREEIPDDKYFINHNSKKVSSEVIDILTSPYELSTNWELVARIEVITEAKRLKDAVVNSLLSFKAKKIEQQISDSQMEIKKAEEEERYEEISDLLAKAKRIEKHQQKH